MVLSCALIIIRCNHFSSSFSFFRALYLFGFFLYSSISNSLFIHFISLLPHKLKLSFFFNKLFNSISDYENEEEQKILYVPGHMQRNSIQLLMKMMMIMSNEHSNRKKKLLWIKSIHQMSLNDWIWLRNCERDYMLEGRFSHSFYFFFIFFQSWF